MCKYRECPCPPGLANYQKLVKQMFQEMENLFGGTRCNQSFPRLLNTPTYGGKPVPWLCAASFFYQSDLLLTLNSFCSLRALFFFFFCCCSYFPLTLIIQMYWGPCALPHHKGNHRTSDQKSCQMYLPGTIPRRGHSSGCQTGLAASAKQDGDITCFQKKAPQKKQAQCKHTATFGD